MSLVYDKGNYRGYYKFRESDDRVQRFSQEWFENKLCLDIGCNEGTITIDIAKSYAPRSIVGVDTDKILIENAQGKIKRALYSQRSQAPTSSFAFVPRSVAQKQQLLDRTSGATVGQTDYPHNIHFVCKSIDDFGSTGGIYDTIVCLSVVKWIHLNEGDAGLLAFFRNVFNLLHAGGLLILEFQPWKSYLNNRTATEHTKANFGSIQLRPEDFERVLTEVGFTLEQNIGCAVSEAKGFDRPIFVLRKKSEGADHDLSGGHQSLKQARDQWEEESKVDESEGRKHKRAKH